MTDPAPAAPPDATPPDATPPDATPPDAAVLLAAYDAALRDQAEVVSAETWERHGPLIWSRFVSGRGFVTYRDLLGWTDRLPELVADTVAHYAADPGCGSFEWKTRGHDHAPGLADVLTGAGLVAEQTEAVMIGRAEDLAVDVPLPKGVSLRRIESERDVRAMVAMQDEVFGDMEDGHADELLHRLSLGRGDMELYVAEADGVMVCAGRLEPVLGTDVAGVWGGATLPAWRGRGIYRALTAERARSAVRHGKTLVHSDSTPDSRPILQRSGFVQVTTTTPFVWRRVSG